MSISILLSAAEKQLLHEAAEWHLLSLLFSCPAPEWRKQVTEVSREVADAGLRAAAEQAVTEGTEGLYHSIFGPGGPAPAREASYDNSIQLGYLLSELQAYYDSFAYRPVTVEALDHVSVEAGFVAYLRMKEAYALAASDQERAAVTAEAAQKFIEEHLSAIAQPLAATLADLRVEYLAAASQDLFRRVGQPRCRPIGPEPMAVDGGENCDSDGCFEPQQ